MSLPALATQADALAYGVTVSDSALLRASTRIRRHARQDISASVSTVQATGPTVRLAQRPVVDVSAVRDAAGRDVAFQLLPGGVVETLHDGVLTVTYSHGWAVVPEEIVELCVTVAARLDGLSPALSGGVAMEVAGSETVQFGFDSHRGVSGLLVEEKAMIDSLFPKRASLVVMRSW